MVLIEALWLRRQNCTIVYTFCLRATWEMTLFGPRQEVQKEKVSLKQLPSSQLAD